ncbi:ornithine cyclodeaminase [Litoreibacter ascidiaceicola]|uniref:Ornithine cyclodeaminase n=1 Tax=Litoreibacter ascidiaceicola TaxID=1486859 RepID=A0A1M5BXX3_9RHOB|nr:ornithine cyclodeaminase [Litoreibacter ascidiaceicola]SHF47281.1 ornithine cyclodeaminase [Litoreibacter ascidiaceicola]
MSIDIIGFEEGEAAISWAGLTNALAAGHTLPKAEIGDTFLYRDPDTLLSRSAWIDGLGVAVKSATIFPGNKAAGRPVVNGSVSMFSDETGELEALVDFHLVTKWKTAGDSLYAAKLLANPDPDTILVIGTGTVAGNMIDAYRSAFPHSRYIVWGRNTDYATTFAEANGATSIADLADAVQQAQIICTATMTTEPILKGEWLQAGQHLDLIGAYRPDMREVDDKALQRAKLFVDSFETTLDHIGELKIPLESGAIQRGDIQGDFYTPSAFKRSPDDITICKNGGGAHLDLMTCRYILDQWKAA